MQDDDDDDYDDDSANGSDSDASDGKAMVKNRNLKQSSVDKEINNRRLSINKNTVELCQIYFLNE
jgi:hypothetical protein